MKSTMAKGVLASSSAVNVPISLAISAKSLGFVASRLTPPRRRLCLDGPKHAALVVRPWVLTYRHSTNFVGRTATQQLQISNSWIQFTLPTHLAQGDTVIIALKAFRV
jgi:hypothetical protein